jgi:hypothetical protein
MTNCVWEELKKVIRNYGMSFPWEDRVPVNTGRGNTDTNMAAGLGRECVSESMSIVSGGDRRDDLTYEVKEGEQN